MWQREVRNLNGGFGKLRGLRVGGTAVETFLRSRYQGRGKAPGVSLWGQAEDWMFLPKFQLVSNLQAHCMHVGKC